MKDLSKPPPHIYAVASRAFHGLSNAKQSQARRCGDGQKGVSAVHDPIPRYNIKGILKALAPAVDPAPALVPRASESKTVF